jgi:hypothetical protein
MFPFRMTSPQRWISAATCGAEFLRRTERQGQALRFQAALHIRRVSANDGTITAARPVSALGARMRQVDLQLKFAALSKPPAAPAARFW